MFVRIMGFCHGLLAPGFSKEDASQKSALALLDRNRVRIRGGTSICRKRYKEIAGYLDGNHEVTE